MTKGNIQYLLWKTRYYYEKLWGSGCFACSLPYQTINKQKPPQGRSLFIGAGGTMTREMAVIGVPTISIYQDELLDVDKFLIAQGLMTHNPELNASQIREVINNIKVKTADVSLLTKGKEAYNLIKTSLVNLKKNWYNIILNYRYSWLKLF